MDIEKKKCGCVTVSSNGYSATAKCYDHKSPEERFGICEIPSFDPLIASDEELKRDIHETALKRIASFEKNFYEKYT